MHVQGKKRKVVSVLMAVLLILQMLSGTGLPQASAAASSVTATGLPSGWQAVKMVDQLNGANDPGNTNSAFSNGQFSLSADGGNMGTGGDNLLYTYMSLAGNKDFRLTARLTVTFPSNATTNSWAVMMVKDGSDYNSNHVSIGLQKDASTLREYRRLGSSIGGGTTNLTSPAASIYVRMARTGQNLAFTYSTDGSTFTSRTNYNNDTNGHYTYLNISSLNVGFAVSAASVVVDKVKFETGGTGGTGSGSQVAFDSSNIDTGNPPSVPTAAPVLSIPVVAGNTVNLAWTTVTGATYYNVKVRTATGTPQTLKTSDATTSYSVTGLDYATAYYFTVSAANSAGEGPSASEVSATTGATPQPPGKPAVSATAEYARVTLKWPGVAGSDENTTYTIKYGTSSGQYGNTISNVLGSEYTIKELVPGTIYYFIVTGTNSTGTGADSDEVSAVPLVEPLQAPKNLRVPTLAYDEKSIMLVWEKPDYYDNIVDYKVYRNGVLVGTANQNTLENSPARKWIDQFYTADTAGKHVKITMHNFTATGLEPNTPYTFTVRAVNANGNESPLSNAITQTTTPIPDVFNIVDYGAVADGTTLNTKAIQAAIDAATPGSKVLVPAGVFKSGAIWLKSDLIFEVAEGGTLLGSENPNDYPFDFYLYDYSTVPRYYSLINAHTYDYGSIRNIRIVGKGTIDGNGWKAPTKYNDQYFPEQVKSSSSNYGTYGVLAKAQTDYARDNYFTSYSTSDAQSNGYAARSNLVTLRGVENVFYGGFTALNPANHTLVNLHAKNVTVAGVNILTFDDNNADGIEFGDSEGLTVFNTVFDTGDDCMNFAAGQGAQAQKEQPTGHAYIFNNFFREGHGGIVTGSHTGAWIENILAEDNVMGQTDVGLRMKTTSTTGGGGRNVVFRDTAMKNGVNQAFIFTSSYADKNAVITFEPASIPAQFRDIQVRNVSAEGFKLDSINVAGSGEDGFHENISFEDVKFYSNSNSAVQPTNISYMRNSSFKNVIFDIASPWKIATSTGLKFTGTTTMNAVSKNAAQQPVWSPGSALTVTSVTYTSAQLSWTPSSDNTGVSNYRVYVNGKMANSSVNGLTYTVTGLSPGRSYSFQVEAVDATGNWTTGPTATVVTPGNAILVPPTVPTAANSIQLAGTRNPTWLNISWTAASATYGISEYVVYANGQNKGSVSGTSMNVTGLQFAAEYTFEVEAKDAYGNSAKYPAQLKVSTSDAYDITAPKWPSDSKITASEITDSSVKLSWTAATDDIGVTGYRIYMNGKPIEQSVKFTPVNTEKTVEGTTNTYRVTGLAPETAYTFKVEAGDARAKWTGTGPSLLVSTAAGSTSLTWKTVTFGQSTDLNFASNVLPEKVGTNYAHPDQPGTINGKIVMESRGGKIANGHDGLTFYYTTLDPKVHNFTLEADVTIEQFGPETSSNPNNQEGAGLMVRDINGPARKDPMVLGYEETPAASNLVAVGAMRVSSSVKNKVRIFALNRNGVKYPWGNTGSTIVTSAFSTNTVHDVPVGEQPTGKPVRLKLERTNDKFILTTTYTHVTPNIVLTKEVSGADLVQAIDPDHLYVGFFVARNAKMIVENASLTLSAANTAVTPPPTPTPANATMSIVSAPQSGSSLYDLKAMANYDGTISVTKDGIAVVTNSAVRKNEAFVFSTTLESDTTNFGVAYTPSGAPTSTPITQTITVTKKIYNGGAGLYVSPDGSGTATGTIGDPMDLATAIKYVLPGETIFMRGGVYAPSATVMIGKEYSGLPGKLKQLTAYNGEKVTIDGRGNLANVIQLKGDYWHLTGIAVTQATSTGMRLSGDHNLVELMEFSYNGDTGFQISGSGTDPNDWPKYNLILNCESHDNRDSSDINADGFAAKLGVGAGNIFRGNISHHNIDDGWDLYNKIDEGPNMPITLEGNISYSNGKLSNGYNKDGNTGNGFKLGGEGIPVAHIVRNNIAFDNNMDGFSDNFNPGAFTIENNTSFNNKRFNFVFRSNPYFGPDEMGTFANNLSFRTNSNGAIADYISGKTDVTDFFFNGNQTANGSDTIVQAADFVSLTIPEKFARDTDGSIIYDDFLRIAYDSILRTAGKDGGYVGALAAIKPNNPMPEAPAAPSNLTAIGGIQKADLSWGTIANAETYNLYRSTEQNGPYTKIASGLATTSYTDTGLAYSATYYYVVTAVSTATGESSYSNQAVARTSTFVSSSRTPTNPTNDTSGNTGGGSASVSGSTVETTKDGVRIASEPVKEMSNGNTVSKVTISADTLTSAFSAAQNTADQIISIQVTGSEAVAKVEIPASALSAGAQNAPNAVLVIKTDVASYKLPAKLLDNAGLAKTLDSDTSNVKINVTIEKVSGTTVDQINEKAKESGFALLSIPVEFSISAEANGKTVSVNDFGSTYVPRSIVLAQTADSSQMTAVLYNPATGEMSFVPGVFATVDGKTEVTIMRPGNSIYTVVKSSKTFSDMNGHWAKSDVELLASKLVVNGVSDASFVPDAQITRAEFAALLARAAGLIGDATATFTDVKATDWFAQSVGAASRAGLVDGFDNGEFQPNATITREQMAVMITRVIAFTGKKSETDEKKLISFADSSDISGWAKEGVAVALNAGLIGGTTDTTIAPKGQATRAEAAVMLKRLLQYAGFMN